MAVPHGLPRCAEMSISKMSRRVWCLESILCRFDQGTFYLSISQISGNHECYEASQNCALDHTEIHSWLNDSRKKY